MKITLESTETIETINRTVARIWKETTESGIDVICYIPIIAVAKTSDLTEFEREFSKLPVNRYLITFDMRMM